MRADSSNYRGINKDSTKAKGQRKRVRERPEVSPDRERWKNSKRDKA